LTALLCLVVAISDGDTLKVRCPNEPQRSVRIASIDAPERRQPWGERSRQALASLCFRQTARIEPQAADRWGRTVAAVECQSQDVAAAQVQAGMAWVFPRYAPKGSPLYGYQDAARAARVGLWADLGPVAPWEWRRAARLP
jgi:endonuclease YncB( thermonuclease family)